MSQNDSDKPIRVQQARFLKNTDSLCEIPVEIVAVRNGVAFGVPTLERLEPEEVEPGDVVEMVIQYGAKDQDAAVGFTDDSGFPVYSTELVATRGHRPRRSPECIQYTP